MKGKKLELQWPNKDKSLYYDLTTGNYEWVDKKDPRVSEPRILVEKELFGDKNTENILIKGDNLLGLKALLQDYRNKVKLIYIDPPFNTGAAFEYYDDGLEQSIWLSIMRDRLSVLRDLLSPSGLLFISIDDNEMHYLKVVLDELFGKDNFLNTITVKDSHPSGLKTAHKTKTIIKTKSYLLVYKKGGEARLVPQYTTRDRWDTHYNGFLDLTDDRPKLYKLIDVLVHEGIYPKGTKIDDVSLSNKKFKEFCIQNKDNIVQSTKELPQEIKDLSLNNPNIVVEGTNRNNRKIYAFNGRRLATLRESFNPVGIDGSYFEDYSYLLCDIWDDIDFNNTQNEGGHSFPASKKPEMLIARIISMATSRGDIVLDSFAGSGTTGAVAHKMGRRWIMIELGNHAETHIIPRLKAVVSGEDQGGISKLLNWQGGGGFKYFELGDSLFIRDSDLRLTVINPKMYNGALIRAVLKVEGFKLKNPDNGLHGISGTTAAHVTEQYLTQEYIDTLLNEIGDQAKFVVIYAKTISSKIKLPDNVEVRRIPDVLLKKFVV